ncbi:unnamed protein product [Polarella glacialis]|uniref:Uncharacterized protein n=1 Tax=Polarella glacialis TaxID=89957 RepID=A0A813GSZ5_POLGL|nr:unnamed protein product [Polarella glacialis]CAE8715805.1 unnamed protein product [Polarella glacialis]|mmetsp:Transcript_28422/g.45653  ORF Transcript_28422/g.45653 Transcript_28422/m.45653 type:complete len:106 (+) Transcript_28422:111-428(+)|eukprot:CAMPEP_0115084970 /NCGR_PEP_ID=MMETSP0227-20121206/21630_1 /TAXON_ID=89957 /ORGANISM="Polarella glacialis, Strain CCMP 1383" /LENGTH=105 /DNA_ID=CAMNT_0002473985 /DNA_START=101 /DNA_END=418 /DNA_ORIENTATION=+
MTASSQKTVLPEESPIWSTVSTAGSFVGTGVYNAGAFVGNTAVGTAEGLSGTAPDPIDESWGKYLGHSVGFSLRLAVESVGVGANHFFQGACVSKSAKISETKKD